MSLRPAPYGRPLLILFGALALSACRPASQPAELTPGIRSDFFDATNAYRETTEFAALYPRHAGTPGGEQAAQHIRARLQACGLESFIDSFPDDTPTGTQTFHNVFARLPGRGRGLIILASHYDTKPGIEPPFCGANDSASSSGVLIELARTLAPLTNLPPEILFVFFDGEECARYYQERDGFHGSRHFARQLVENGKSRDIKAFILMDMVGDPAYTITIPRNSTPALIRLALDAAQQEGIRTSFSLYRYGIGDDHDPFLAVGIPSIDLIDFEYGSAPGRNDYWHTPADTLEHVSAESLGKTGRVVLRMLNALTRSDFQ